jgi:hypothetical protein
MVYKAGWHTGGEVDLPEGMDLEFWRRALQF